MAKKATGPKGASGAEPVLKRNVVSIRGTEEWRKWLFGLAAFRRLKATDVIDQSLVEYAERHGYGEPAPPR